jgi:hypothetical protein
LYNYAVTTQSLVIPIAHMDSFKYKYIIVVILGFLSWIVILWYFRTKATALSNKDKFRGYFIFGPMFSYMRKRGFALTKREIIGWGIVLLLMLAAPFLENLF